MSQEDTKYSQREELKLIESAKLNPAYFAPLYDRYYRPIFLFIFKRYRDKELSADLTSQVFLKAMLNIGKYQDKGFPFSAWLFRIAYNEMNMFHRKNSKYQEVEIREKDFMEFLNEMDIETKEKNIETVLAFLEKLDEEPQRLIQLRFFDKLSFKEIGDLLGITEDNAKVRSYRAIEKLKKMTGGHLE
jgi:RNA polymerase sigma-70 factor (ECF subfamily)